MSTLSDVAKLANVSKMTVSRVVNHPEQVTDELKELVFKAMHELQYRPNVAAKALVNSRTHIIKVFILEEIDTTEPYYMNLIMGIAKYLDKNYYTLQLVTSSSFDIGPCDGYIITGMREQDFGWISKLKLPVVLFGENKYGFDCVDSDNAAGTYISTNHTINCGYKRLVFIGIDIDELFEQSREAGYKTAVLKNGNKPEIYRIKNSSTSAELFISNNWHKFTDGNIAFICASDRIALGVERGIVNSGGKLPMDFGVTGFDGVFLDQVSSIKLTTVKQDIIGMGECCAELLMDKIKQRDVGHSTGRKRIFDVKLIVRKSTRQI